MIKSWKDVVIQNLLFYHFLRNDGSEISKTILLFISFFFSFESYHNNKSKISFPMFLIKWSELKSYFLRFSKLKWDVVILGNKKKKKKTNQVKSSVSPLATYKIFLNIKWQLLVIVNKDVFWHLIISNLICLYFYNISNVYIWHVLKLSHSL